MKVYIKNKLISIGGASKVLNENEQEVFHVKGKVFSPTRKKTITDKDGKVLYYVRNKWFNWFVHRAYILDENKQKIATVKDKLFTVRNKFFVENYKDEIRVEGNFMSLTSKIYRGEDEIGTIKRKFFALTDSFELEADEQDIPFLTALVIAIDNISDKRMGQKN
ncbi:MAG: LURP-one-related family protein [Clostridia bacterium]|nr:LURP-one-related family protein [Clostridia bacterium]